MLSNYFFIKHLSIFLNDELQSFKIADIFSQEKNKVVISFLKNETEGEIKFIEFSVSKDFPYLILKKDFKKARKNYAQLFEYLYGSKISTISMLNDDRVITISLTDNYNLYFFFLTGKQNLIIAKDELIIDAFKVKEELFNKKINDLFVKKIKRTKEKIFTVQDYIKSNYYKYGNIYFEEVLFNLKINKDDILTDELRLKIDESYNEISRKLNNPEFLLYFVDGSLIPSLMKLNYLDRYQSKRFNNINELFNVYVNEYHKSVAIKTIKKNKIEILEKKEKQLKNKIESLKAQIENNLNYPKYLDYGNIILYNKNQIEKGQKFYVHNGEKIPLDEKLNAVENAEKYFGKYKKGKSNLEDLKDKLRQAELHLQEVITEKEKIKNLSDFKIIKKMEKDIEKSKDENPDLKNFRIFKLDDNFEVWVGKNSHANDLLTTKYSAQNDLWFHIRDYSGSHTVLKRKNKNLDFPKNYISIAASIAAYYSKAKNAGTVAVAYCERKYVKKRKGFKEGTVIMEREKVIFVKPELPQME